ncbi:beta-ketoacyl-ACP synthase III [Desulfosarcina ovata subsp. sediminis]|uniref:Beta-ketoacyl-ACP synthase III n=1 Tax=Desulfosarcina ovata subsp. sediminis TaxID=885957 RepID=A0A5K7ZM79_9BACT|nr:beta-ketoacyl-ACP synthase III [Desulfosarcina ovata]BBO82614.1 beta-ketoacyl-ACP synthase III [Desulfosarcina ovata subsp. sediminis]
MAPSAQPRVVISGSGLWTPENVVTNEELVASYNAWAARYNQTHAEAITAGEMDAKPEGSEAFIEKAAGIKQRYVYVKEGILDIDRMRPIIPERPEEALSDQAEIAIQAARQAMSAAGKTGADIDAVIVSCAYTQRAYPAIAIEVQAVLGIDGFGFDMLVACSAATFGLHRAYEMVAAGTAHCVLAINPELMTPQVNYCDRDSHFIFGDVATAAIVERADTCTGRHSFDILGVQAQTRFSSNVRSNFGHLSRANDVDPFGPDKLFHQNGRRVFKEVCPLAIRHMADHIDRHGLSVPDIKRWWLHQANIRMNQMICTKLIGREATFDEAPIVLDRYANTASAGSLIAFHLYHADLQPGDHGVICSFGAGYSVGSLVVRKR